MRQPVYIGLDLGTSGVRALAIADDDAEIASARVPLPSPERQPGGLSQQDPRVWWEAVVAVLGQLAQQLGTYMVRALAVDATSATVLLCDPDGNPLTPALLYDDSRSRMELARIAVVAPADSAVHSASSSLAKLLHLSRTHPLNERVRLLHQADWIAGRLSGHYGFSDENNCLKLGYDPVLRQWPAWLQRLGIPVSVLPTVYPAGTAVARVCAEVAAATGLPASCRIVTGTTDSTAAALAAGLDRVGQAVTSLGSTLVLKVLSDRPVFAPDYGVYSHRIGDLWLVGGASNSGGAVCARYFSREQMRSLSTRIDPERSTGLDYYPLLKAGERFPYNDPDYPPRLTPRPDDDAVFFQGLLEGMAAIEQTGYRRLAALGAPYPLSVASVGGGAGNQAWVAIRRRYLGVAVTVAGHHEAAYGAALLARRGVLGNL